jgi:hypothetical protein
MLKTTLKEKRKAIAGVRRKWEGIKKILLSIEGVTSPMITGGYLYGLCVDSYEHPCPLCVIFNEEFCCDGKNTCPLRAVGHNCNYIGSWWRKIANINDPTPDIPEKVKLIDNFLTRILPRAAAKWYARKDTL